MERNISACRKEIRMHHYRLTPQREAVLSVLLEEKNTHFTPYELFRKAKRTHPELGLATVYRALRLFMKLGLVREVQFNQGPTYYEFRDSRRKQHYHLVCKKCGHVEEINGFLSQHFIESVVKKTGFSITDYSCQFYGYCEKCKTEVNY
ncbi:MAG: Fur family transcriptional regulator [Bacillota bacterium]|nr:Fur family transcriptional regulator [Bacillota bacterium]